MCVSWAHWIECETWTQSYLTCTFSVRAVVSSTDWKVWYEFFFKHWNQIFWKGNFNKPRYRLWRKGSIYLEYKTKMWCWLQIVFITYCCLAKNSVWSPFIMQRSVTSSRNIFSCPCYLGFLFMERERTLYCMDLPYVARRPESNFLRCKWFWFLNLWCRKHSFWESRNKNYRDLVSRSNCNKEQIKTHSLEK